MKRNGERTRAIVGAAVTAALAGMLAGVGASAQDKAGKDKELELRVQGKDSDTGLIVSARATAKEVGLPVYPGAVPHKDEENDSSAAKLGLWGNSFGFKLVVLKMESKDSPQKVAEFYKKALAKYGVVLDCTNAARRQEDEDKKTEKLTCGGDRPEGGGMLFKAGTKRKQHIVGVESRGTRTVFQLIYVEARDEEREPA